MGRFDDDRGEEIHRLRACIDEAKGVGVEPRWLHGPERKLAELELKAATNFFVLLTLQFPPMHMNYGWIRNISPQKPLLKIKWL